VGDNVSHQEAGVQEGQVLAGKYRIEKVLGVGGMGVVVAARHMQLDTKVAIKFLLPEMLGHVEAVARFAREAKAAVKITGEHVARVLDVGVLETGAPYMVMEFLEGSDLSAVLRQRGALPVDQAVDFLLQASVAVAEAHSLGIIHRDLKPANLFCIRRADGKLSVKVLDFGISKVTDPSGTDSGMSVTKTSAMMGSPLYMSPEQMQASKSVDARADVWALGVILYELLTGKVPFDGDTVTDVAIKVAMQPVAPIRTVRPDIPEGLQAVLQKCLEKSKEQRYANVAALAVALNDFAPPRAKALVERICDILQVTAPPQADVGVTSGVGAPMATTGGDRQAPAVGAATMSAVANTTPGTPGGNKRAIAFAVVGVCAGLGLAAAALVVLRKPAEPPAAAAAMSPAASAPAASASVATLAPEPSAPVRLADPAADVPTAAAQTPPSSRPVVASNPTRGSAKTPPGKTPAPPPPVAAAPAPAPAPAPHPTAKKNALDLGGFQ
jgi:serine/threonine-protein kinase